MKKYLIVISLVALTTLILVNPLKRYFQGSKTTAPMNEAPGQKTTGSSANPASQYCEDSGGKLEIVTESNGGQFGSCKFEDYSCEEWLYFRGECSIEKDAEKIKEALTKKGLNLSGMKVVIKKHLGKYIAGSVIPVSEIGGGGYVFAVKDGNEIKILADGNGVIMCSAFEEYPDFSSYLVPECVDESGNPVAR